MRKRYKNLQEVTVPKNKKPKKWIKLAGIYFTLLASTYSSSMEAHSYNVSPTIERVSTYFKFGNSSELEVNLNPTELSTRQKMERAFSAFIKREGAECLRFRGMMDKVINTFEDISVDKASVDGYAPTGDSNVSLLLPEGFLFSINLKEGVSEDGLVSFNLYKNRELLVADVQTLASLKDYIKKVQSVII